MEKGYNNTVYYNIETNQDKALKHILTTTQLPPDAASALSKCSTVKDALTTLSSQEEIEEVQWLRKLLSTIQDKGLTSYIYLTYLSPQVPKFLYFDEYYQIWRGTRSYGERVNP